MLRRNCLKIFGLVMFISNITFVSQLQAMQLSGYFSSVSGRSYLITFDRSKKIEIRPFNTQAAVHLSRLKTGDLLAGTGDVSNDVFVINSIDFVGLKELLGVWLAGNNIMDFQSFSSVKAHLTSDNRPVTLNMKYSITPGEENEWHVFFSDNDEVQLATLTLKKNTAALQFIDSQTGDLSKVIELKKITSYQ
jgi:hypothetical protein